MIGVVIGFMALLRIAFIETRITQLINVCIGLLLTYFGFKFFVLLGWLPESINAFHETLALSLSVVAGLLTLTISFDVWKRLHLAIIVGGLIFIFFPVLLVSTHAPTIYWPSPSHQAPTLKAPQLPQQNTIVLLLDEFSASHAGPVVDQLKDAGLQVTSTSMIPAGKHTVNVIPAIWSRSNFDQSAPCGPTQLCSGSNVLDFSKVKASSDNIDIVGFFHRYCSIQGLRSCFFEPFPTASAGTDLLCRFPGVRKLDFLECDTSAPDRSAFIALRAHLEKSMLEAPFWEKGGVLYAHMLQPHPLMGIPLKSLQEEYTDNIAHAAAFGKIVAQKAKLVFGDDFNIIVFSDHPLRVDMWCNDKNYIKMGCQVSHTQSSTKVPLIVATPAVNKKPFHNLSSNQNIFDLLY
jgi:hypothetical protein